ncbi:Stp1/IreP family PP2C-type Ser/Thr phosphatase [Vagococcus xieshaowenii]|uniref:protein-serine/threonine phosphatase n=1 Tax=Vagococcus xieshaowenii TaxID=2562451 RepID=A0AAJ5JKN0_9ENTE|nr:Stp1/IreP family PP2C-type Ser/Thr phosphatase [Vagococcus xieshaowenii]QCA28932.1 Stp1/IreP family PP2C-type Ser/Thr phosphatase [Vagococcus xieshaowenii]TFZ39255.1 Stp1/IreP family PP2C-type Ser/Thr phosphatase [Vagococcus xieshaowenii]
MKVAFQTNVGKKRSSNQDSVGLYINQKNIALAIVADGMGGHQAGDIASQLTVSQLGDAWEQTDIDDEELATSWLNVEIQRLNHLIYEEGIQFPERVGMGTTIVAAVVIDKRVILFNVGDSRSYRVRGDVISQLTEDHSLVNELVKTGEISKEEAQQHPRRNVLTRSLGLPTDVEIDSVTVDLLLNDYIILCTDGLSNMVPDERMLRVVSSEMTLKKKVTTLIEIANEAGGKDNITVLLMDFEDEEGEN